MNATFFLGIEVLLSNVAPPTQFKSFRAAYDINYMLWNTSTLFLKIKMNFDHFDL